jgi:hypothetical protein
VSAGSVSGASVVAVVAAGSGALGAAVGGLGVVGLAVGGCQWPSGACHHPGGGCPLCHLRSALNHHVEVASLMAGLPRRSVMSAPPGWGAPCCDLARPVDASPKAAASRGRARPGVHERDRPAWFEGYAPRSAAESLVLTAGRTHRDRPGDLVSRAGVESIRVKPPSGAGLTTARRPEIAAQLTLSRVTRCWSGAGRGRCRLGRGGSRAMSLARVTSSLADTPGCGVQRCVELKVQRLLLIADGELALVSARGC